ncbi:hypothetical protein [Glaciecola sp. MF2-115]|uniref:hypothetical protein n=1 Tax=Glaciecola sp. MF2-115 TaxID=3384827 RepID=UPI0039A0C526
MTIAEHQNARTLDYLDIDMRYTAGRNNYETGKLRRKYSMMICGRFKFIAPVLIKPVYNISHRLALLHLNKLVEEGYLAVCRAPSFIDGRVYVLTYLGASYASQLLQTTIQFRSESNPSRQLNHSTLYHDMMNAYVLLRGVNNYNKDGEYQPLWDGFVNEREFSSIYTSNTTRTVDGLVREISKDQTIVALEVEASFKKKAARKTILLKYLEGMNAGIYKKVFMVSQHQKIFQDIKRFHSQLLAELPQIYDKRTKQPVLTNADVLVLKKSIIFRTKFCDELQNTFYP